MKLKLNMTEISKLYNLYSRKEHNDIFVLMKILEIDKEFKFMTRVFSAFRGDDASERFADFRDYVFVVWTFCTLSEKDMIRLGFDLYSVHRLGKMDINNLIIMVQDIYGVGYDQIEYSNDLVLALQTEAGHCLSIRHLHNLIGAIDVIFTPIKEIQKKARAAILSTEIWTKLTTKRTQIDKEKLMATLVEVYPAYCGKRGTPYTDMSTMYGRSKRISSESTTASERIVRRQSKGVTKIEKMEQFQVSRVNAKKRLMELHGHTSVFPDASPDTNQDGEEDGGEGGDAAEVNGEGAHKHAALSIIEEVYSTGGSERGSTASRGESVGDTATATGITGAISTILSTVGKSMRIKNGASVESTTSNHNKSRREAVNRSIREANNKSRREASARSMRESMGAKIHIEQRNSQRTNTTMVKANSSAHDLGDMRYWETNALKAQSGMQPRDTSKTNLSTRVAAKIKDMVGKGEKEEKEEEEDEKFTDTPELGRGASVVTPFADVGQLETGTEGAGKRQLPTTTRALLDEELPATHTLSISNIEGFSTSSVLLAGTPGGRRFSGMNNNGSMTTTTAAASPIFHQTSSNPPLIIPEYVATSSSIGSNSSNGRKFDISIRATVEEIQSLGLA